MSLFITLIFAGSFLATGPATAIPFEVLDEKPAFVAKYADETEVTDQTYSINRDGKVSVSNINGSIEVTGWDRPEVQLISKKVANTRERLQDLEIKVISRQDLLKVDVDYKRWKGKWVKGDTLYVNFTLMVPRTAVIDELESVNGSIEVSGTSNFTKVSAVNGAVKGSDLKGSVDLSTVNGTVLATFDTFDADSRVVLGTVNGSTQIRMPSNVNATVKADSVNGSIVNDFGLPVKKGKYVGRGLYGRIGAGGSSIKLSTVNGSIKIQRNDDGLELNPVKNLLPQKTSDDFDETFDENMIADAIAAKRTALETSRIVQGSLRATRAIEEDVLRQTARIAAEATQVTAESLSTRLADVRAIDIDQNRINAEVAAITSAMAGARPAPFIVEDSKTIKVGGVPSLTVDARGCNVTVKGWDRNEIRYVVTRLARGRTSPVRGVSLTDEDSELRLNVQVVRAAASGNVLDQVRVEVYVPSESNLTINTDREIRLEGVTGDLNLNGMYGGIDVRDAGGALEVNSKNGTVRVIGFDGELDSRIGGADMYLDGDFERISSHSKGGKVYLTMDEDPDAIIKTNAMGIEGVTFKEGKTVVVNGMQLKKKSEDVWQLGEGRAEYEFRFVEGSLILRPRTALGAE